MEWFLVSKKNIHMSLFSLFFYILSSHCLPCTRILLQPRGVALLQGTAQGTIEVTIEVLGTFDPGGVLGGVVRLLFLGSSHLKSVSMEVLQGNPPPPGSILGPGAC